MIFQRLMPPPEERLHFGGEHTDMVQSPLDHHLRRLERAALAGVVGG